MAKQPKRVSYRKYEGDDKYSWAVFLDGRPIYTGMDRSEAQWRAKAEEARLTKGRKNHES